MDGDVMAVILGSALGLVVATSLVTLLRFVNRAMQEQCPERESDGPPMEAVDGAILNTWAKTNKWTAR